MTTQLARAERGACAHMYIGAVYEQTARGHDRTVMMSLSMMLLPVDGKMGWNTVSSIPKCSCFSVMSGASHGITEKRGLLDSLVHT